MTHGEEIPERYTVEEYLKMERASEVRHEYLDGAIFEMAGESLAHRDICTNLIVELGTKLRGSRCRVLSKDTKVRNGALSSPRRVMRGLFSYPDLVIVCGTPQFHDEYSDILLNPQVIIEVLSEATEAFDRGEKFQRYREHLSSLTDYILVAQDRPYIEHFTRRSAERWEMISYEGTDSALELSSLDYRLQLAEVYDRVEFLPTDDVAEEPPFETEAPQGLTRLLLKQGKTVMIELHPKVLEKNGKKEFVMLPYVEFVALQEILADAEDVLDLRAAKFL